MQPGQGKEGGGGKAGFTMEGKERERKGKGDSM